MAVGSLSTSNYVSNTNSGSFTIDGLGDGTDWTDLIDATVEAESYRLDQYEEDLEEAESAVDLLTALDEEIIELTTTLQSMDEMDEFLCYTGSVSGDEVSVAVEDGAAVGTYNLVVNQLAQKDVWIAEDFDITSTDSSMTTSNATITLSYAGEEISISVSAGTTAEELVDQINSDPDCDDKITASLVYDGENYHLKLAGEDTGADNAVTVSMNLTGDDGTLASSDFTNTLVAQNAQIKIDGYPSGEDTWMERDSNSVDDVIDNMTVTLSSTTDSDGVTIGVSYDTDAMTEVIESFITDVNQLIYDILDLSGVLADDDDDDDDSVYIKGSTLDIAYSQIKNILSSAGLGFAYYDSDTGEGDLFTSLSTIGISTDSEEGSSTFGQLELDSDELEDALSEDPEAVALLFAASGEYSSDSSDMQVISTISGLTGGGDYDIEYTVSGGVITSATIDGVDMKISGNTLLAQSDSDANGLYVQINNLTDGSYSHSVSVKQGKCSQLADLLSSLSDAESGSIPILIQSYEDMTTKLDNDIYYEESRLDALETRLTEKYAALDEMLSYYSNLETQLDTTLAQLES
ncbi:flagellar filament capping protein FliD [Maridesulfovibrio sp.]|uniref:flagellar filament capping protein FliD n=1 Tax=Maridesulfovibrio sp. TaxID=2795000 RepID=UPI002A18E74C|nr:flagellar filament capping protein FliD [Maridesulfovibrio sp.]